MARSKLNAARQQIITDAVANGCSYAGAARAAGVTKQSVSLWMKQASDEIERRANGERANRKKTKYVDFLDAIKKAEGRAESELIASIKGASKKTWTAAAWILERRWPKEYARIDRLLAQEFGNDDEKQRLAALDSVIGILEKVLPVDIFDLVKTTVRDSLASRHDGDGAGDGELPS